MSATKPKPLETVPREVAHRVVLLRDVPAGELLIHELYRSVQGESSFAGMPCVFVRCAVCDSRCVWCDTPHAFSQGERMSREAVRQEVLSFNCPLVEITGGEPLLQADAIALMSELADAGRTVLLETSGAHDVGPVDPRSHRPRSNADGRESDPAAASGRTSLKPTDEIKP